MRKFIAGVVAGCLLTTVCAVALVKGYYDHDYEQSYETGRRNGLDEAAEKIGAALRGELKPDEFHEILYSGKWYSVCLVHRDGVPTLRVKRD